MSQRAVVRTSVFLVLITAFVVAGRVPIGAAESAIEASQTAFDRWVTLQESIASEKSDWVLEKEYLQEEIRLLKEEIEALTEKHGRLTNETATIEADLKKIEIQNDDLEAAAKLVEGRLPEFEKGVRDLNANLPPSLQSTVEMLVNRLPEEGATTQAGASERLQVVVGILSQVDKANGQMSVVTEVKPNSAGEQVQVRVLYLGLAAAWFVSQDGKFAGYGRPAGGGWEWTEDDALAATITRAIAIHDNTEVASYVELPVSYK